MYTYKALVIGRNEASSERERDTIMMIRRRRRRCCGMWKCVWRKPRALLLQPLDPIYSRMKDSSNRTELDVSLCLCSHSKLLLFLHYFVFFGLPPNGEELAPPRTREDGSRPGLFKSRHSPGRRTLSRDNQLAPTSASTASSCEFLCLYQKYIFILSNIFTSLFIH